jgi:hypothetical protein
MSKAPIFLNNGTETEILSYSEYNFFDVEKEVGLKFVEVAL